MKTSFEIKEEDNSIEIENISYMTLIISKSSNENEKDFNWFLTNEEELMQSIIEPIGLKNQTVNIKDNKFIFEFNIKDKAKTSVAKFVLKQKYSDPNDNKTKKDLPINIKEVPKKPIEPEIFIDDSDDLMEIDDKELLDFDSDMIILDKDKVKSIKIKGSVSDDNT